MARSSSSSAGGWSGGADIIDLDRYYRDHVRPSRTSSQETQLGPRLVVDAGGVGRKIASEREHTAAAAAAAAARHKRHSQDSGVSDGSYVRRRPHRPHRRASNPDGKRVLQEPPSARVAVSRDKCSDSSRAFRSICEQTLIDQQRQLERVAQLCERLAEQVEIQRAPEKTSVNTEIENSPERSHIIHRKTSTPENLRQPSEKQITKLNKRVEKSKRVSSDTSDISSSSCSTKDFRGKHIHPAQKCKTYKIIMTKLDELNRRFGGQPAQGATPRPAPPRACSASSVSVSDKLVATEPQRTVDRILMPTVQMIHSRETYAKPSMAHTEPAPPPSRPRVVTQAYNVDIPPREVGKGPNIVTENVIVSSCRSGSSAAGDPCCGFDLEDPVHLYSQAKRLQAMNATTRRAHSVEPRASSLGGGGGGERASVRGEHASARRVRSPSLCSVCRGYWRSLRQCIIGPFIAQDCKCN